MSGLLRVSTAALTKSFDRISSYLFWKGLPELYPDGVVWPSVYPYGLCPICDGDGVYLHRPKVGEAVCFYCLCATVRFSREVDKSVLDFRSYYSRVSLERIDTSVHQQVGRALGYVADWAIYPQGRLVISGGYGTGKSHILQALAGYFHPISLYITAADFESAVFRGISTTSLDSYMDTIKRVPILFLDDLGMEYGSPIVMSQLESVVDFRYRSPEEFPMAVATNYSGNELQNLGRCGSRLMDRRCLVYAGMPDVPDYRLKK